MEADTGKEIQALGRMVDNLNSTRALNGLGYQIAIVLACSARRKRTLSKIEEEIIQAHIDDVRQQIAGEPYDMAKALMATNVELWEKSKPKRRW